MIYTGQQQKRVCNTDPLLYGKRFKSSNLTVSALLSDRLLRLYTIASLGCFHYEQYRTLGMCNYAGKRQQWKEFDAYRRESTDPTVTQFHCVHDLITQTPSNEVQEMLDDVNLSEMLRNQSRYV
jgi:hypothetical protein